MTNPDITEGHRGDEISLLELWLILRAEWMLLVGAAVVGIGLAVIAGFVMTPVYRAEAVIAEVQTAGATQSAASSLLGQFSGLAGLSGVNLSSLGRTHSNGRTIIQSRTFIEQFIEERNLLPLLFSDLWDDSSERWDESLERPPALWQGANKFSREVYFFEEDNETGLLTIAVEWPDAEQAALWANRLITLANERARQRDITDAEKSIEYLQEQIELTNAVELERVLYNLVEAEQKTLMLANAREDYVFQVVDPAVVPVSVARPKRLFLIFLGALLGGFLGLIVVIVRQITKGLNEQAAAYGTAA